MNDHVSRETPSLPSDEVLGRAFPSDRLPRALAYAEALATDGVIRGLIGPREAPRLWERHLLNCAALAEAVPDGASVADIGSGAGLPGLVLAIARPDARVTLIEPLLRRTTFLEEMVEHLDLDNVEVRRGRADAVHGVERYDVVTSRAVSALGTLLDWSMPLVSPDGALVAMKGSSVQDEVEAARSDLSAWQCAEPEILTVGTSFLSEPVTLVRVAWSNPSRVGFPPVRTDRPQRGGSQKKKSRRRRP